MPPPARRGMSEIDRIRWDERYAKGGSAPEGMFGPPPELEAHEHLIPVSGAALEIACGRGRGAVWLARRGLDYDGVDVSPIAIDLARMLAEREGVDDRCEFRVHDLDSGLPSGPPVDLLLCYKFRDPRLDRALMGRLATGGVLAIATLSEVGAGPGPHRAHRGELTRAFSSLEILVDDEGDGMATLIGRKV